MIGTPQVGATEQQQMAQAVPCGDAYHLPFNDGDPGRLIARERDAAYAALEQKMMDTSHKSALIAIKCLTLKRQRDELLAGLEMCRTEISASTASGQPVEFLTREVAQIDKAIAAVREVQP